MTNEIRFDGWTEMRIKRIRSKNARAYLLDLERAGILHKASDEIRKQRINHPFPLQNGLIVHEADYRNDKQPFIALQNRRFLDGNITLQVVHIGGFQFHWRSATVRGLQSGSVEKPTCIVFGMPGETVSTGYFAVFILK